MKMTVQDYAIKEVLVTEEQISKKIAELGAAITRDYAGKDLLMVSILKGSVMVMADLMRAVDLPLQIDFMNVSSYGSGTETKGAVKILKDLDVDIKLVFTLVLPALRTGRGWESRGRLVSQTPTGDPELSSSWPWAEPSRSQSLSADCRPPPLSTRASHRSSGFTDETRLDTSCGQTCVYTGITSTAPIRFRHTEGTHTAG